MADLDGVTPYERERLAQIARNRARLTELGLSTAATRPRPAPDTMSDEPTPKRRPPMSQSARTPPAVPRAGSRRSARAALLADRRRLADATEGGGNGTGDDDGDGLGRGARPKAPAKDAAGLVGASSPVGAGSGTDPGTATSDGLPAPDPSEREPAQPGSSRTLDADLDALRRLGPGCAVPGPPTKASVMAFAAPTRGCPKFSKYSGSVEWANAVFLFVNVGGSDYTNVFFDGGRRMSWFAGGRQHEGTPVVQRLLARGDEDGKDAPARLLFCRTPGQGGPPSPYVYCGRVAYMRHYPGTLPLEVEWALEDFEVLAQSQRFQEFLQASRPH